MLSMVIADFKARLKLKNILKIFNISFVPLIYTFLLPLWNTGIKNPTTYWGTILGLLISIIVSRLFPFELSQMMYLVPLTQKDKHDYLKTAYILKCVTTSVISIVIIGAATLFEEDAFFIFLFIAINTVLINLTTNSALPSANKTDKNGRNLYYNNYTIFYTIVLILIALGSMIIPFFTFDDLQNSVALGILLVYELFTTICALVFIIKNWNMVMDNAMNFEKSTYVTEAKDWKR